MSRRPEVVVEGLKLANIHLHLGQPSLLLLLVRFDARRVVRYCILQLLLQLGDLAGHDVGVDPKAGDAATDLIKRSLEAAFSGNAHELGRCTDALEHVVDASVLAEHVAVADTQDPCARVAVLALVLVEKRATLPCVSSSSCSLVVMGMPSAVVNMCRT